jgi:phenylalanyl-tRNA synthetase alpha chain
MGIENVRFKPAYNPYTEVRFLLWCDKCSSISPSAFNGNLCLPSHAETLGRSREQWDVPTRNAGANGISKGRARTWMGPQSRASDDDQVCVMFSTHYLPCSNPPERYGIDNIRTLLGHKVSIEQVESSPAVRF